jgi:YD repeat-containing protein
VEGATISGNDEMYSWVCCTRLGAFTDALGTASLSYDGRNRLTSFAESNGNNVAYEYDTMGRITKLTPAQGSNYRTEYQYNANGSVSKVKVYDAGTASDTDYVYTTTTGRLTERHFPTVSSAYNKTAYSYDSYSRLEYGHRMADTAVRPTRQGRRHGGRRYRGW